MAIKVSAGGGIQVIPNAKEVLKKIQEYMPPKRYMHYFDVNYDGAVFAKKYRSYFSFSVPSADSPSVVAGDVKAFLKKSCSGLVHFPCSGILWNTNHCSDPMIAIRCYISGDDIEVEGKYPNPDINTVGSAVSLAGISNVKWDHSIEI